VRGYGLPSFSLQCRRWIVTSISKLVRDEDEVSIEPQGATRA
jgi:hypothetical protein